MNHSKPLILYTQNKINDWIIKRLFMGEMVACVVGVRMCDLVLCQDISSEKQSWLNKLEGRAEQ